LQQQQQQPGKWLVPEELFVDAWLHLVSAFVINAAKLRDLYDGRLVTFAAADVNDNQRCVPVADLEGGTNRLRPPPFARRTDVVTHGR